MHIAHSTIRTEQTAFSNIHRLKLGQKKAKVKARQDRDKESGDRRRITERGELRRRLIMVRCRWQCPGQREGGEGEGG